MKARKKLKRFRNKLVKSSIKRHVIALKICFMRGFTAIFSIGKLLNFIKMFE
jgi:hypothetical protein